MAIQLARRWKLFLVVAAVTMAADQLSKLWARASLPTDERGFGISVEVIENFWAWRLSYNTGSAFGLFHSVSGARVFLTIIGLGAIGAILWMVKQARDDQRRLVVALGLVGGGALGNIFDRLVHGKVTDFVVWKYHTTEWPTFNIADAALVIGVGLLFLDVGREKQAAGAEADKKSGKGAGAGSASPARSRKKRRR
jgi:signal peptidase II